MISDDALPELSLFRSAETVSRFETSDQFGPLVVAGLNERSAVHRWFRFKESFAADLLKVVIDDLVPEQKRIRLLDPFCGVGTSLVAAQELSAIGRRIHATGIERNPFIAFAARTKVSWPLMSVDIIRRLPPLLLRTKKKRVTVPNNSSFTSARCMSRHITGRLLHIADGIRHDGNSPSHDALLLGLAAAIEPLSRTRKDGRALRLVEKQRTNVSAVLTDKWNAIVEDTVTVAQSEIPLRS